MTAYDLQAITAVYKNRKNCYHMYNIHQAEIEDTESEDGGKVNSSLHGSMLV